MTDEQAIDLLVHYGVVRGDTEGNLLLTRGLTRAEAATIFIRAIGMERDIRDFMDVALFTDTEDHWAQGYINLAWKAGLMKGYEDETFRPEQNITYAEMLTVILRIIQQEPTAGQWPENVMDKARELGVAPSAFDLHNLAFAPAQRGRILPSLGRALRMPVLGNASALQRYLDEKPPRLTMQEFPHTTPHGTVTLAGHVDEQATVTINDRPVDVDPSGGFRATLTLTAGTNQIIVKAVDLAGNEAVVIDSISRQIDVSRFVVHGPDTLEPGESASYQITLLDNQGRQLPDDLLRVDVQGNAATWNHAQRTLTASNRPGNGVLVLRAGDAIESFEFRVIGQAPGAHTIRVSSLGGSAIPPGHPIRMVAQILDSDGFILDADNGRPISLTMVGADESTITWERDNTTYNGSVYFTIISPESGTVTVTATAPGVRAQSATLTVGTMLRISLNASPRSILANGTATTVVNASLRDQQGRTVTNNTGSDISVLLHTEGTAGILDGSYLHIPTGHSTSTGITFTAGTAEGAQHVSGSVISGQAIPVDATSIILVKEGSVPPSTSKDPVKLDLVTSTTSVTPGATQTLTVRVLDSMGRLVTTGNYAFQISVTTTNKEEMEEGLPVGVNLKLGNTSYAPVDDGFPASDPRHNTFNVVGRTVNGQATVRLTYGRSGYVTATVRPTAYDKDAVQDNGTVGPAISSLGMSGTALTFTYTGTPAKIQLTVDSSALGKGQTEGSIPAHHNSKLSLRAELLDATDALIPRSTGDLALEWVSGDRVTSAQITTGRLVDGVATFQITGSPAAGTDRWRVQGLTLTSNNVQISTRTARPDPPVIRWISGLEEGIIGEPYLVAPDDTHMRIELEPMPTQGIVVAKVYRTGQSQAIHVSEPFDITTGTPVVLVPKSKLTNGQSTYQVTLENGAGESARSASSHSVASVRFDTTTSITSASYSALTRKLIVYGSGIAGGTSGGSIDPTKLFIEKDGTTINLGDAVVTVASGNFTLDLTDAPALYTALETPSLFSGAVNLRAEAGWYRRLSSGLVAQPDTTANPVTPMANITSARLDLTNKRLILQGVGFASATLDVAKIAIRDGAGEIVKLRSGDSARADGDRQITITLSTNTLRDLGNLSGVGNVLVTEAGWTKDSRTGRGAALDTEPPVYSAPVITRATYDASRKTLTLVGSGFTNGTVDVTQLAFHNPGTSTSYTLTAAADAPTVTALMITIRVSDADAAAIAGGFTGASVTLTANAGWLVDDTNRPAAPIEAGALFPNR